MVYSVVFNFNILVSDWCPWGEEMEPDWRQRTKLFNSKSKFSARIPKVNNRWRHICPLHQSELCSGDSVRVEAGSASSNRGQLESGWCWGQTGGIGWQPEYPCSCPGPPSYVRCAWHEEQLGPDWGGRGPGRPSFRCRSDVSITRTVQSHVPIICKYFLSSDIFNS